MREQITARQERATTEHYEQARQAVLKSCRRETDCIGPRCPDCDGPLLLIDVTYRRDPLGRDDGLVFSELTYHDTS